MDDLNDKINDGGATSDGQLSAPEWNQLPSEIQNLIVSSGQVLSGADLEQLVKGIAKYSTVGAFFTGAGVVNAYTATAVGTMLPPPTVAIGMKIRAIVPITNTGNSTLNAFNSGVFSILQPGGGAISSGELIAGTEYEFIYREAPSTHWEVLNAGVATVSGVSLQGLSYPTIDTSDNKLVVTPASATNGGTVTYPAGTTINLGQEQVVGETGIMAAYNTSLYLSADLDVSSTYYLRAHWASGSIVRYVQKGTDTDAIPASLIGTPGGASGGGFDSTVLDLLIAKVTTGTAGTTPTVVELANKAILTMSFASSPAPIIRVLDWGDYAATAIVIDWARTPIDANISMSMATSSTVAPNGSNLDGARGNIQMIGIRFKTTLNRFSTDDLEIVYDDSQGNSGSIVYQIFLRA